METDWIDFTTTNGQPGQYKVDGKITHVRFSLACKAPKMPRKKKKASKKFMGSLTITLPHKVRFEQVK